MNGAIFRWKEKLGEELDAVEVVTFDYPCEYLRDDAWGDDWLVWLNNGKQSVRFQNTGLICKARNLIFYLQNSASLMRICSPAGEMGGVVSWLYMTLNWLNCLADISGGKRKAPPKAEKLVDHHLDVVKRAIEEYPGHPLILVGKSMGSR